MFKKRTLFIGRFQPFHKGHLSVVKDIYNQSAKIIIGIGSAEDSFLPENPFTAGERYEMIERTLEAEGLDMSKIAIIPVRNINNYALWVKHVTLLLPKFEVVYTGSSIVRELFEKDGTYEVLPVKKELEISATMVREKMLKSEEWEDLVPDAVVEYLKKIKGEERISVVLKNSQLVN